MIEDGLRLQSENKEDLIEEDLKQYLKLCNSLQVPLWLLKEDFLPSDALI